MNFSCRRDSAGTLSVCFEAALCNSSFLNGTKNPLISCYGVWASLGWGYSVSGVIVNDTDDGGGRRDRMNSDLT